MSKAEKPATDFTSELVRWSEALASVAKTGLAFTESPWERERFREILHIAGDIASSLDSHEADLQTASALEHVVRWEQDVKRGLAGYTTPKVAVGAIVGNENGELLLIQRADSGLWLYPTGWCDVGYSPAEVAAKEVWEETGIECRVDGVAMVLDGIQLGLLTEPLYSIVFHCTAIGGELKPHPHEVLDVGWFARDAMPTPLANPGRWVDLALEAIDNGNVTTWFDPVRDPVWRGSI